jgi:hypothetical protein
MELIESKTLASTAASIEFTSIPQDGTDLVLLISSRGNGGGEANVNISLNGSTSNFSSRKLQGTGNSVNSDATARIIGGVTGTNTTNVWSNDQIYISNYTSNANKSFSSESVTEANATTAYASIHAHLWANTAAITSISIAPIGASYVAGSTISLYKVVKGSDGIVTTS